MVIEIHLAIVTNNEGRFEKHNVCYFILCLILISIGVFWYLMIPFTLGSCTWTSHILILLIRPSLFPLDLLPPSLSPISTFKRSVSLFSTRCVLF